MANLKFNQNVKRLFIECFNMSSKELPSDVLHTHLTVLLHESGDLTPDVELTALAVREAYETLGLNYKNRPKGTKLTISFEEDTQVESVVEVTAQVEEVSNEELLDSLDTQEDEGFQIPDLSMDLENTDLVFEPSDLV